MDYTPVLFHLSRPVKTVELRNDVRAVVTSEYRVLVSYTSDSTNRRNITFSPIACTLSQTFSGGSVLVFEENSPPDFIQESGQLAVPTSSP